MPVRNGASQEQLVKDKSLLTEAGQSLEAERCANSHAWSPEAELRLDKLAAVRTRCGAMCPCATVGACAAHPFCVSSVSSLLLSADLPSALIME